LHPDLPSYRQADPKPVISLSGIVLSADGGVIIYGNEDVHSAVVVEVSDSHAARGETFCESAAAVALTFSKVRPLL